MTDKPATPPMTNPTPPATTEKKKKVKLEPRQILDKLISSFRKLLPYSLFIFAVFVALLYGFVLLKINSFKSAAPSSDAVSSQVQAAQTPRIDPTVVQQLQSLQNNSVSVQALFNQARSNPFQE